MKLYMDPLIINYLKSENVESPASTHGPFTLGEQLYVSPE
jgi:hypothetical protein